MNDNGTSKNETAAIYNIPSPSSVRLWLKANETGRIDAIKPMKKWGLSMKKENKNQTKKEFTSRRVSKGLVVYTWRMP